MTSARPYQRTMTHDDALAELRRCAGTQFDPGVVDAFCRVHVRPAAAPARALQLTSRRQDERFS